MEEYKKQALAALLMELSLKETHKELNRAIDSKNKIKAKMLLEVESAIDTLLEYFKD